MTVVSVKINDCVGINTGFLAAGSNYLVEHSVTVKKKYNNIEFTHDSPNISTIDTLICSSLTHDCPRELYS